MTELTLATEKRKAEKSAGIGWITFNNPARRNAIGYAMREAILEIIEDFESDPSVRVIVMQGAGDMAFVSGSDISEFAEKRATPEQREVYDAFSAKVNEAFERIINFYPYDANNKGLEEFEDTLTGFEKHVLF